MSETNARAVAEALRGEAFHSGGGIWLVRLRGEKLVVISEDAVCQYDDEDAYADGHASQTIPYDS